MPLYMKLVIFRYILFPSMPLYMKLVIFRYILFPSMPLYTKLVTSLVVSHKVTNYVRTDNNAFEHVICHYVMLGVGFISMSYS